MDHASVLAEARYGQDTWRSLANVALHGLRETYAVVQAPLPHTRDWDGSRATCAGLNVRYALISLLGLAKGATVVGPQDSLVSSLWRRIDEARGTLAMRAGDLGLGLWARALQGDGLEFFSAEQALRAYRQRPYQCDSVDLAWLLLGADHAVSNGLHADEADRLAAETKRALLALFNPTASLFYRHARGALVHRVSRRVACFANQIYPTMALALHAARTGCPEAAVVAVSVADKLCEFQGELGQWWWLYDAHLGQVVDGYPVFSVHQDGMAPMALLEVSLALGRSYTQAIERGIQWVCGANELGWAMVLPEQGLILRDIHRRGFGRGGRMIRGALWCCGWRPDHRDLTFRPSFDVNNECRPYHLGWVLYAAGVAARGARAVC